MNAQTITTASGQIINTSFGGAVNSTVSHQWASRPDDERYTSLTQLHAHVTNIRERSRAAVVANRDLTAVAVEGDYKALHIVGPTGQPVTATHWSFGQLAQLAKAPAGYLQSLPAPLTADLINYGLHHARDVEECGVLLTRTEGETLPSLRAATGPQYGRVWNSDITRRLVERFGDGLSADFRVPGEFGVAVPITKDNTTLFASDRDFFVFLADEQNRIEIPNRRDGRSGSLARGFYISNSEVGAGTLTFGSMLFDFCCMNRNLWGVNEFQEIRIRHTKGAPHKLAEQLLPALDAYARQNRDQLGRMETMVLAAQQKKLDDVEAFLRSRKFSGAQTAAIQAVAMAEEGRPIETLWDASAAVTAYARGFKHQDARVDLERAGGAILSLAA
jgi:hypothetical protein